MSLWSEFLNNQGRTTHKVKHYFPAYERHFARYVNRPCVVMEIGVGEGGSLQMWKRYFGPFAQMVGIDIRPDTAGYAEDQIAIRLGSQADESFLQSVIDEFGPPDIVLDDGSHMMEDMSRSFQYLYPRMSPTGVYTVEDVGTSYWDEYGGGLSRPGTFIELSKSLIDHLNADSTRGSLPSSTFTNTTLSMHFYDSMVVFERGRHLRKYAPMTGRDASGEPA